MKRRCKSRPLRLPVIETKRAVYPIGFYALLFADLWRRRK